MAASDAATPTTPTAPATSASAASAMSSDSGDGMARGANYFFGFLITFVALLLIFVGCGVGTRHRRMRGASGFMFDWNAPSEAPKREPRMYEGYLEKAQGELAWVDVMPISATILRTRADEPAAPSSSGRPEPARRRWLDRLLRRPAPPSEAAPARPSADVEGKARRPRPPSPSPPPPPDETLQITMMIAMPTPPRPPHDTTPDDERGLDEYQLGVLQKPWRAPAPHAEPPP